MTERTTRRLAWSLWAFGLVTFVASVPVGVVSEARFDWAGITQGLAFFAIGTVGLVVALHQRHNALGWIYLAIWASVALMFGLVGDYARWATVTHPGAPFGTFAVWLTNWTWVPIFSVLVTFSFLLFPDGHLPSKRWRPLAWIVLANTILWSVAFALESADFTDARNRSVPNPYSSGGVAAFSNVAREVLALVFIVSAAVSVASLVVRFRGGGREERNQIKWLLLAGAVTVVWLLIPFEHGNGGPADVIQGFILALIPLATGVAILKYRLYDIDIVISKTIVFGVLATFITVVYVAIVVGVGSAIGSRSSPLLSGIAAAVVAIAFQPVRRWSQHLANRLVYGRRATPYEVLTEFAGRVGDAFAVEDLLERMAAVLAAGTGAASAVVWLEVEGQMQPAAVWPSDVGRPSAFPESAVEVLHQGEVLGALSVTMPPADPIDPSRAKLVTDLASQAGPVLRNVRLIEELRASRQRIVSAQDERARKLERDIHDGAQQQLVALGIKMRLLEPLVDRDPAKARELVGQLQNETTDALENLRDLARGVYPPLLADQGLAAALEAQSRKAALPVRIEPDGVGRYPQEIEAAVYFCVLEALQNVGKYARASAVTVSLREDEGDLVFEVRDDGVGFDQDASRNGTGIRGMADRLEAVGGEIEISSAPGHGTTIGGRVPVETGR